MNQDRQYELERAKRKRRQQRRRRKKILHRIEAGVLTLLLLFLVFVIVKTRSESTQKHDFNTPVLKEQSISDVTSKTNEQDLKTEKTDGNSVEESKKQKEAQSTPGSEKENVEAQQNQQRASEEGIIVLPATENKKTVMTFGGDICFHDEFSNMYSYVQKGSDISKCISADLLNEMRLADIFMVNNEFTYTDRGEATEGKTYAFRSKPSNVKILSDMGVDIVSLANNHAYDYGEVSLLDTLDTLDEINMPHVGAGKNLDEARRPVVFEQNGITIAYLSATQIERLDTPDTKGATENSPGVYRCWGKAVDRLVEDIKAAKEKYDFVVVYIHWGTENTDVLDWAQLDQAKMIAGAGADFIIGDHPHCLQQLGSVDGVPIIYSLGNFWFNSKTLDSCLVKITLTKDGMESFQFLPAIQQNCTTRRAEGEEKIRILNYMRQISLGVTIDDDGFVLF